MKKLLGILLSFTLLLSACAHPSTDAPAGEQSQPPPDTPTIGQSQPTPTVEPPQTEADVEENTSYWAEHFPRIDGSTSLIPLETAIRASLLQIPTEQASQQVIHSTTYDSFYHLIDGTVDMTLTVPLSQVQREYAEKNQVQLEQVPVAKEGFVFVVNADNPIDSLTQEQLRAIYSGSITNWKQLGGEDLPIIAYQRNNDSGSQNYMIDFMGDTPLMEAPTEQRPTSMIGLMDVIAVNDYAQQSIGYSVYSYAADMYENSSKVKFLAIDGVKPTKQTMASGEYPLLSENYALFLADQPQDSPVRRLCRWMTSDEGQQAIARAGYVPLREVEVAPQAETFSAYSGTGSGDERLEAPMLESIALDPDNYYSSELPLQVYLPESAHLFTDYHSSSYEYTTGITYTLNGLQDKQLQQQVNDWIAQAVLRADEQVPQLTEHLKSINQNMQLYEQHCIHIDNITRYYPSALVSVKAKNGYLWATVAQVYYQDSQDGYDKYFRTECQTWDLFTGKELAVEELFQNGLDVDEFLNQFLLRASQTPIDNWGHYPQMKADFVCLPETGWAISPEAVYIDLDNPYFALGLRFSLEGKQNVLCSEQYRKMEGLFDSSVLVIDSLYQDQSESKYRYLADEPFRVQLLDETVGDTEVRTAINRDFLSKIERFTIANAIDYFAAQGKTVSAESFEPFYHWTVSIYGNRLVVFSSLGTAIEFSDGEWTESRGLFLYDLKTGQPLEWQQLLVDGWEEQAYFSPDPWSSSQMLPLVKEDIPAKIYNIQLTPSEYPLRLWFLSADGKHRRQDICLPVDALKMVKEYRSSH